MSARASARAVSVTVVCLLSPMTSAGAAAVALTCFAGALWWLWTLTRVSALLGALCVLLAVLSLPAGVAAAWLMDGGGLRVTAEPTPDSPAVEPCLHDQLEPVTSLTGETVAALCSDCLAQLPAALAS